MIKNTDVIFKKPFRYEGIYINKGSKGYTLDHSKGKVADGYTVTVNVKKDDKFIRVEGVPVDYLTENKKSNRKKSIMSTISIKFLPAEVDRYIEPLKKAMFTKAASKAIKKLVKDFPFIKERLETAINILRAKNDTLTQEIEDLKFELSKCKDILDHYENGR